MSSGLSSVIAVGGCLFCLAAVVILIIAIVLWRRSKQPQRSAQAPPADPFRAMDADVDAVRGDPRLLKPGDIIDLRGTTYTVRGSMRFTEGGWGWSEHFLDDASDRPAGKVWLSVEEDPDLELVLWSELPGVPLAPNAPTLQFEGVTYTADESGTARYTSIGTTGLLPTGTLRYHDYRGSDGSRLSFESYGDSDRFEVGRGAVIHQSDLQIYPQAG
jgi:hypothetical protein